MRRRGTGALMDEGRNFPLPASGGRSWENQVAPARRGPNGGAGGRITFGTIACADDAAQCRVLARSTRACYPGARLVVLFPDAIPPPRGCDDLYDLVLRAEDLALDGLADMRFRYMPDDLCAALKPWTIRHLLDRFADDPVCYLDPDIELFSPLDEVEAALAHGASLALVPRFLEPCCD